MVSTIEVCKKVCEVYKDVGVEVRKSLGNVIKGTDKILPAGHEISLGDSETSVAAADGEKK